jgi:ankyrin repeat protein
MSATSAIAVGITAVGGSGATSGAGDSRRVSPAAEKQRSFDFALDLILTHFPRDAVALRFRDRAAWRDPDVLFVTAKAFSSVLKGHARRGDVDVVGALIAQGIDPSAGGNCALRAASENGRLAIVEHLLADPRVDPSADNNLTIQCTS